MDTRSVKYLFYTIVLQNKWKCEYSSWLKYLIFRTIRNKEFQKSKMGIDVFDPSCREFFLVILRPRFFFFLNFFEKESIFRSNFRDFTGGAGDSFSESVWLAGTLFFGKWKLSVSLVNLSMKNISKTKKILGLEMTRKKFYKMGQKYR